MGKYSTSLEIRIRTADREKFIAARGPASEFDSEWPEQAAGGGITVFLLEETEKLNVTDWAVPGVAAILTNKGEYNQSPFIGYTDGADISGNLDTNRDGTPVIQVSPGKIEDLASYRIPADIAKSLSELHQVLEILES